MHLIVILVPFCSDAVRFGRGITRTGEQTTRRGIEHRQPKGKVDSDLDVEATGEQTAEETLAVKGTGVTARSEETKGLAAGKEAALRVEAG